MVRVEFFGKVISAESRGFIHLYMFSVRIPSTGDSEYSDFGIGSGVICLRDGGRYTKEVEPVALPHESDVGMCGKEDSRITIVRLLDWVIGRMVGPSSMLQKAVQKACLKEKKNSVVGMLS